MLFHRDRRWSFLLFLFATVGCDSNSTDDTPPAANTAATSGSEVSGGATSASTTTAGKSSSGAVAKAPATPTAEQVAKWTWPEFQPLALLDCKDGFGDPAVWSLGMSPDGKQFALGGAKLTLWNTKDAQPIANLLANYKSDEVERPLRGVAISPDGKLLAAGDQKGIVRIWNVSDQSEVARIEAHKGRLTQLAFSPNSTLLATTSYSGEVIVWSVPAGTKLKSLKVSDQEVSRLLFVSDSLLATAGSEAAIWNVDSSEKATTLTTKRLIGPALGLTRDRRWLAYSDADAAVHLWDVEKNQASKTMLLGAGAHLIDFSPDGKWIATYTHHSPLRIWEAATGRVVQAIDADGGLTTALHWLPEGNALLAVSEQGRVRIWGDAQAAQQLGIEPLKLPTLAAPAADVRRALSSAQLQQVIDIRSFPRLPGAVPQWNEFGMAAYVAPATQAEGEMFYRYQLAQAGWTETPQPAAGATGLLFRKSGCELNVTLSPATPGTTSADGSLQVNLQFAGNYDARWLPKISPLNSKASYDSFSSVSYRTKGTLTDVEVAMLKQFHAAGWTPYTRLAASSTEDPHSRSISMLQGGSVLTVSIGHPADSTTELAVQTSVNVSSKSLPIPPDAGWIEFDSSTDLQMVVNTKLNLQQTAEFYDAQMAAEGWLAREAGRDFKDDKGWLPYIRGQQDVFLRLATLPSGGTRITIGDAASSSWQLKPPPKASDKSDKPGIEAADFTLPAGAMAVKFDIDQKRIDFEVAGSTPVKLGELFVKQMESLNWKRDGAGVISDEYVFITYKQGKAEIELRARSARPNPTAMISGDGLLWTKPLPAAPVRVSYGAWLRRGNKQASLDHLDEFTAEMQRIPVVTPIK